MKNKKTGTYPFDKSYSRNSSLEW